MILMILSVLISKRQLPNYRDISKWIQTFRVPYIVLNLLKPVHFIPHIEFSVIVTHVHVNFKLLFLFSIKDTNVPHYLIIASFNKAQKKQYCQIIVLRQIIMGLRQAYISMGAFLFRNRIHFYRIVVYSIFERQAIQRNFKNCNFIMKHSSFVALFSNYHFSYTLSYCI